MPPRATLFLRQHSARGRHCFVNVPHDSLIVLNAIKSRETTSGIEVRSSHVQQRFLNICYSESEHPLRYIAEI